MVTAMRNYNVLSKYFATSILIKGCTYYLLINDKTELLEATSEFCGIVEVMSVIFDTFWHIISVRYIPTLPTH
jgi:hypothetical protein